jgi:hypothetical protein
VGWGRRSEIKQKEWEMDVRGESCCSEESAAVEVVAEADIPCWELESVNIVSPLRIAIFLSSFLRCPSLVTPKSFISSSERSMSSHPAMEFSEKYWLSSPSSMDSNQPATSEMVHWAGAGEDDHIS